MDNKRRNFIINEMLLFSKQQMEADGLTQKAFLLNIKFSEEYYLMGIDEPKIKEDSKHLQAIKKLTMCTNDEIVDCLNYCLSHEMLTKFCSDSYKITYSGLNVASAYEEELEYKKSPAIKRFFAEHPINWTILGLILTGIGLIVNAIVNLDKLIANIKIYIIPIIH